MTTAFERALDKAVITILVVLATGVATWTTNTFTASGSNRADAANIVTLDKMDSIMASHSPWARDKAGVEEQLRGVNQRLDRISQDMRDMSSSLQSVSEKNSAKVDEIRSSLNSHIIWDRQGKSTEDAK